MLEVKPNAEEIILKSIHKKSLYEIYVANIFLIRFSVARLMPVCRSGKAEGTYLYSISPYLQQRM